MRASRVFATLGPALLVACSHAQRTPSTPESAPLSARVQAPGMLCEILYTPADASELDRIERGLVEVAPLLARWGAFRQGVFVRVFPDHDSLEAAVDRRGYPWLRAWAFADQVLLQSPQSWSAEADPALEQELHELLAHELTHSLMYQLMQPRDENSWPDVEEPPLWFREGMASFTAGQGHRRLSSDELTRWLSAHRGADLLHPSAELYRTEKEAVYGAAHRAFDLLVTTSGEQSVRDLLRAAREGARFADAFKAATRQSLADFEQEAVRSGFNQKAAHLPASSGAGGP